MHKTYFKAEKVGNQTLRDADAQFKFAVACVWVEYLSQHFIEPFDVENIPAMNDLQGARMSYREMELDHIKNKVHGNRYDLYNVQLITSQAHAEKHASGEYIDLRPAEYVAWLKNNLKPSKGR